MPADNPHLKTLYRVLRGGRDDRAGLEAALLESVRPKVAHSVDTKRAFFAENAAQIAAVACSLADGFRGNEPLFSMGNGGSSRDAVHIADEWCRLRSAADQ